MRPSFSAPLPCLALAAALCVHLVACVNIAPPGTVLTSEPPGASVLVDGRDSGWVTPCALALDTEETHKVEIVLPGYASREILLLPDRRMLIVSWGQAVTGMRSTLTFPTRLPVEQLLFPFQEIETLAPGRVFVRLRPESAP
jgi:hypothetical protein